MGNEWGNDVIPMEASYTGGLIYVDHFLKLWMADVREGQRGRRTMAYLPCWPNRVTLKGKNWGHGVVMRESCSGTVTDIQPCHENKMGMSMNGHTQTADHEPLTVPPQR